MCFICINSFFPVDCNLLLFKVSTIIFINQNQIKNILNTKFPTYVLVTGGHIDSRQVQSNGNYFSFLGTSIH